MVEQITRDKEDLQLALTFAHSHWASEPEASTVAARAEVSVLEASDRD